MGAYRICKDCGAALDPGELCDCRGAGRAELIQPESASPDTAARHRKLLNVNFAEAEVCAVLRFAEDGA